MYRPERVAHARVAAQLRRTTRLNAAGTRPRTEMARAGRPYAVGKEQLRHALLLRAIGERAAHSVVDALDAPELLSARYSQLGKPIKMGGYARGWQGRRRRVSGRASAL